MITNQKNYISLTQFGFIGHLREIFCTALPLYFHSKCAAVSAILITKTETKTEIIDFSFTETKTNTEMILKTKTI